MGDDDLFAADIATARVEAGEILKHLARLLSGELTDPAAVNAESEMVWNKSLDLHNALQKLDGWRDFIKDKQVNEMALMEALAENNG